MFLFFLWLRVRFSKYRYAVIVHSPDPFAHINGAPRTHPGLSIARIMYDENGRLYAYMYPTARVNLLMLGPDHGAIDDHKRRSSWWPLEDWLKARRSHKRSDKRELMYLTKDNEETARAMRVAHDL
jgi:hypothetical protein